MNLARIVAALSVFVVSPASAQFIRPSFDCGKTNRPDERAICWFDKLAELDNTIAVALKRGGDNQTKDSSGDAFNYLAERRSCGFNTACILDVQVREISQLDNSGARIPIPEWIGSYRLFLLRENASRFFDFLPVSIGTCTKTKIVGILMQSGNPHKRPVDDVNYRISVQYDDQGFQVSSAYSPDLAASVPGDDVVLCLDAVPKSCMFNEHVRLYSATNLRTKGSWILPNPDAKQVCGGV